jgi:exodeoxyribonuclease III
MKLISYNVNGIRAALRKGFLDWLKATDADVVALQEVKSTLDQISPAMFEDLGYEVYWHAADKKGYSGVATLSRVTPKRVQYGMGKEKFDMEGRVLRLDFEDFSFINTYFPSGTTGEIRQTIKYEFLDDIYELSKDLKGALPGIIWSGDYNICHKAIDIHDPVSNKKSSGFLPEERAWMDKFTSSGFNDTFRLIHPEIHHQYTWWSYRANSRSKNKGWRIDYHMATENLSEKVKDSKILSDIVHSDHCPILLEVD